MFNFSIKKFRVSRIFLLVTVLLIALPDVGRAQSNYSTSELDTLVSFVALYPDPLLVHVLTATTYGEQIPGANDWAQSHKNLGGNALSKAIESANLSYDPSVQALLPFPTVLAMMAKYNVWRDQLGDAVANQKDDVMDAIQRMRQAAYDHGHLQTDDKVKVEETSGNIEINPVNTEVVYVPVYNPRVVYHVYADGYTRIAYGSGAWLGTWYGEWGWGSCWFDWGPRIIYVRNTRWYARRPIPHHPHRYNPPPRPRAGMRNPPPSSSRHSNVAPASRSSAAPLQKAPASGGHYAPVSNQRSVPATQQRPSPANRPVINASSSESVHSYNNKPQNVYVPHPFSKNENNQNVENRSQYGNSGNNEGRSSFGDNSRRNQKDNSRNSRGGGFGKSIRR